MMRSVSRGAALLLTLVNALHTAEAFQTHGRRLGMRTGRLFSTTTTMASDAERMAAKERLLELLVAAAEPAQKPKQTYSTMFIDRLTKQPLTMERINMADPSSSSKFQTGDRSWLATIRPPSPTKFLFRSADNTYVGYSNSYLDLLEPYKEEKDDDIKEKQGGNNAFLAQSSRRLTQALVPLLPPPLRSSLSTLDPNFLPMRDLFTNPAVSFAYERGWRQGFAQAGFPGVERETELANDYFAPVVAVANNNSSNTQSSVLVDMSCATGLFTRRFCDSNRYGRVLGCDYSPSMLEEAIRRRPPRGGQGLDWIRLDVAQMPFADASVDVLHAGAAMHCWPELPKAAAEIYRVLKPGGRYFATTFLSSYFANLQSMDAATAAGPTAATEPSRFAFQYFKSVNDLRKLMEQGGFEPEKIQIEVLGAACVVIRCEK